MNLYRLDVVNKDEKAIPLSHIKYKELFLDPMDMKTVRQNCGYIVENSTMVAKGYWNDDRGYYNLQEQRLFLTRRK